MIQGIRLDDCLPLWGLFVAMVVVILLSLEAGYRLGGYRRQHSQQEKEAPVGAMTGTTFGLLAFMLAFTFGLAASRHDTRRGVLLDEANAIGTAYLRAGLLPEPHSTEIRDLLRQYVDVRLEGVQPGKLEPALRRSEELHRVLWAQAVAVAEKSPGPITGLFVQSLNEVIDLHSKRVMVGLRSRIPGSVWAVLYLAAILAMMALGYHTGLTGTSRSPSVLALVLTFSTVLLLIADLDRPGEGLLRVSQEAMTDLRHTLSAPKP